MKIFFDTEFTGLYKKPTLISIGMVAQDGREFYCVLNDYDKTQIDDFVGNHVRSIFQDNNSKNKKQMRNEIERFIKPYKKVEFWSDYLSNHLLDWVLFNQIWEYPYNIPHEIYRVPFDLCTLFKIKGIDPDVNREQYSGMTEGSQKQNALWDAKVIRECYLKAIK